MPDPGYSRDPTPPSRRQSITNRLLGSFNRAREDTSNTIQRRTASVSRQSPTTRIREWLDTCNAEHEHHCSGVPEADAAGEVPTWRPAWLVDCVERNIVRSKPADRYLALSYVWGTGPPRRGGVAPEPPAQLLKTTLDAYQLSLPEEGIPQTIVDAMWLSKKLGIRYLWVDRLCIVQDDEGERESHVQHMAYVFANAYLTLIASFGDVYTGLLPLTQRRPAPRSVRPASRDHSDLLSTARWTTRGWTLEERLYSRRAVFFFEDAITWECHCELWQGSGPSGIAKAIRGKRHVCTSRLSGAAFGFQHAPWPDLDEYAQIAAEYSSRRVTVVDDTLRAFAGITHVLSRIYPGGFLYGMPLMFLDIAMLWRPQASIRRRALSRPPFLPSWSWMGFWFDGVPADFMLWRAAADYVEDNVSTKGPKKGQSPRRFQRFQPSHSFRIRPTVTWSLTDRSATVPVANTGFKYRDMGRRRTSSGSLPAGWSKAGPGFFKHDSDDQTVFRYPIPVEDPPEEGEYGPPPGETAFPGPFLSFKTTAGLFDVDFAATLVPRDSMNPPVAVGNIWTRSRRWIGEFRAHDGWLGIQSSNYNGDEKLEFIAISTATERKGSYALGPERYEEVKDQDGIVDIVNVLWIERIGGIAYRRGIGHILLKAWEAQAKDEVDILLG